ncbi:hypothetical protein [Tabrizicola sp.]|uniref:hypothetical protein n=1 Tax=Tabrizicola sp. TaxID=2005166 RepID=UPI00286B2D62|nr:hypothetical protein [Tabrizicola sp.]
MGDRNGAQVITSLNPEAAGLSLNQPLRDATAMCPGLLVVGVAEQDVAEAARHALNELEADAGCARAAAPRHLVRSPSLVETTAVFASGPTAFASGGEQLTHDEFLRVRRAHDKGETRQRGQFDKGHAARGIRLGECQQRTSMLQCAEASGQCRDVAQKVSRKILCNNAQCSGSDFNAA